jgi:hypothetical protein
VHALTLLLIALGILAPALWASFLSRVSSRLAVCGLCALVAILAWDLAAPMVISKFEQLSILLDSPWLYAVGVGGIAALSLAIAHLASPPNYAMQRSSRVGTPLAGTCISEEGSRSASGAPTARRR